MRNHEIEDDDEDRAKENPDRKGNLLGSVALPISTIKHSIQRQSLRLLRDTL